VFWSPLILFSVWITIQSWLIFRALRAQRAEPEPQPLRAAEHATVF
jgi:hypothetical protein